MSRQLLLYPPAPRLLSCSDIYYLAFPDDPLARKVLVYVVYAAELTQTILFTEMAFKTFAAGFGNFQSLNEVGSLWFAMPILTSIGMFPWLLLLSLLITITISGIHGPNILRI